MPFIQIEIAKHAYRILDPWLDISKRSIRLTIALKMCVRTVTPDVYVPDNITFGTHTYIYLEGHP